MLHVFLEEPQCMIGSSFQPAFECALPAVFVSAQLPSWSAEKQAPLSWFELFRKEIVRIAKFMKNLVMILEGRVFFLYFAPTPVLVLGFISVRV